ncbi:MAG: methyltransferase domain-containing protein [Patescibacteria group bacterium]|nr:methyltransferase domain-containing protein [Patescibacteria group bacterium]
MQTEAERYLIKILKKILILEKRVLRLINLGAAKSVVVENALLETGLKFICDRSDVDDAQVSAPYVKNTFRCGLENMRVIETDSYDLAFANFVMEHIEDTDKMAKETGRIIKREGSLVITLPNPQAPEFILAKITSTKFHQKFRRRGADPAYPVRYSYRNIANFISIMEKNNWKLVEKKYFPATYSYLHRFPLINYLSRAYDSIIVFFNLTRLLGHVVLHWENNKD